jgi:hypothetical protein
MDLSSVAEIVIAAALIVAAAIGVLGVLSSWFRRMVIAPVVRSIWRMATEDERTADRTRASSAARKERLRSALGVLSEGLSMGLNGIDSGVKIGQAMTELRSEGPADLDQHIAAVVAFVQAGGTDGQQWTSAADLDRLMKPIIGIVKAELDRPD